MTQLPPCIVSMHCTFCARQAQQHGADMGACCVQALLQERHSLTCHVQPSNGKQEPVLTMRLAVSTTTVEPRWILAGDAQANSSLNYYVMDFGKRP